MRIAGPIEISGGSDWRYAILSYTSKSKPGGAQILECGGKRSATPLWIVRRTL